MRHDRQREEIQGLVARSDSWSPLCCTEMWLRNGYRDSSVCLSNNSAVTGQLSSDLRQPVWYFHWQISSWDFNLMPPAIFSQCFRWSGLGGCSGTSSGEEVTQLFLYLFCPVDFNVYPLLLKNKETGLKIILTDAGNGHPLVGSDLLVSHLVPRDIEQSDS